MTDNYDNSLISDSKFDSKDPFSAVDNVEETENGGVDSLKVVTARGTEDGLVFRIDGRAEWNEILSDLDSFLGTRRRFLDGGEVSVEWLERLPTKEQSKELEEHLQQKYGISIIPRRRKPPKIGLAKDLRSENGGKVVNADTKGDVGSSADLSSNNTDNSLLGLTNLAGAKNPSTKGSEHSTSCVDSAFSLTAGFGSSETALDLINQHKYLGGMSRILGEDLYYDEDANAKVVFGTLRSGQRIETPFSLVVVGDVNPGADLIAGGDIIVIGSLKGTAQASAYDDESFDRVIIAFHMQPMQLRIGSVISRGSDEVVKGIEIARIENRRIVVEQFNPRAFFIRRQQGKA